MDHRTVGSELVLSSVHGGPKLFLLDVAGSQIFTRSRPTQKLHFKPINSLKATGAKNLQPKNRCQHEKQRHLVAKIMLRIFLVEAQDPFNILTAVFGRSYYPVKSHFFGISTPNDCRFNPKSQDSTMFLSSCNNIGGRTNSNSS